MNVRSRDGSSVRDTHFTPRVDVPCFGIPASSFLLGARPRVVLTTRNYTAPRFREGSADITPPTLVAMQGQTALSESTEGRGRGGHMTDDLEFVIQGYKQGQEYSIHPSFLSGLK